MYPRCVCVCVSKVCVCVSKVCVCVYPYPRCVCVCVCIQGVGRRGIQARGTGARGARMATWFAPQRSRPLSRHCWYERESARARARRRERERAREIEKERERERASCKDSWNCIYVCVCLCICVCREWLLFSNVVPGLSRRDLATSRTCLCSEHPGPFFSLSCAFFF